jgi:hypothetical protein
MCRNLSSRALAEAGGLVRSGILTAPVAWGSVSVGLQRGDEPAGEDDHEEQRGDARPTAAH